MFLQLKSCGIKLLAILFLSMAGAFTVKVFAQAKIVYAEYFVDVDPGFKNGSAIPVTPSNNLSNLTISIDTAGLIKGLHYVGVRALDENGAWSNTQVYLIYKPSNSATPAATIPKIVYAEFFMDTTISYGKATPIAISPSVNIVNASISKDTIGLKPGIHFITVRALDENGVWSLDQSYYFYRPFAANTNPVDSIEEIVYAEYFIDNDPGLGSATPLAVTSAKQLSDVTISLDTTGLSSGIHYLTLRAKDKKGRWSLSQILSFFRPASSSQNEVGSSRVDLQACKLEYSIVSPK